MPSTAVLEMKKQQVAALSDRIKNSCAGVVVDYKGITVSDDTQLRHELREAGVHYTVVKNTLLGRAAEAAGKADWVGRLEQGTSREEGYWGFANSQEFENIIASYGL